MNTFLPYPSFTDSMRCLDYRRLGKQRVEAAQMLRLLGRADLAPALSGSEIGAPLSYRNHIVTRLWAGYELSLAALMDEAIREWVRRGYRNEMPISGVPNRQRDRPEWTLHPHVPGFYRARLLAKKPDWYAQFGWPEAPINAMPWGWLESWAQPQKGDTHGAEP